MQKPVLTFLEALDFAASADPKLKLTLKLIKERRQKQAKDTSFGRVALSIPDVPVVEALLRNYHPELYQDDIKLNADSWVKFMKHPHSEPFRTNARI